MTIRLEIIAGDSTEFAQKLLGVVGALSFAGQRTAATAAPAPAEQAPPAVEKAAVEANKPHTRKTKEESAPATAEPEPEQTEEPAPAAEAEPVPAGEEKQPAAPSEEKPAPVMEAVSEELKAECQAVLRKVLTTKGNAVAAEILKKFGAKNISTIPAGKHAEFKAECEAVLGE